MKKIVFVCSGNTCRSPMAEGLAKEIAKRLVFQVGICSRGIAVLEKEAANQLAIQALRVYDIDIKAHFAQQFMAEDFDEETIVLTMTQQHQIFLINKFPKYAEKVYTIKEFIGLTGDILDPFGESIEKYQACAEELNQIIEIIFGKV